MGGLKKFMPLTERTYFYACIAIAGFPIANGFFSKDEILWKAFTSGSNLLDPTVGKLIWFVGWLTACGTSFYMWRSYYMTFTGEYRGGGGHDDAHHAPAPAAHGAHGGHGALATHSVGAAHAATFAHDSAHGHDDHSHGHAHAHTPHESPRSMTWVLATLAIGCAATVVLGFWPPLGHMLHIGWMQEPVLEQWLAPVLQPSHGLVASRAMQQPGAVLEWLLIFASVGVAFVGWATARALYKDNKSAIPSNVMKMFPNVHRWVFNKYYVDEFYQRAFLGPAQVLAKAWSVFDKVVIDGAVHGVAWVGRFTANVDGAIDTYLVDGAVNLVAKQTLAAGRVLRRVQTGKIQHYLYAALAGALIVVGINYLFS
jgi:NADH-quinone oxidoreductase subunit L